MGYSEALNALQNGIDVIEDLANGEHGGAGCYWDDAEQFFREAEWELLFDFELPNQSGFPDPPPRSDYDR